MIKVLTFFTDPYPDELLYSVFARYHYYSGNIDLKDTLIELFGKNTAIPSFEIGSYLNYLCERLGSFYTPEKLIQNNTIFPYYAPFLQENRKNEIFNDVIWTNGQGVYTKIGIVAGGICRKIGIYYCPNCSREDILNFGEPYIHRIHQLQGVFVCPQHSCYLKEYPIKRQDRSRTEYLRIDEKYLDLSDSINVFNNKEKVFGQLFEIAEAASYLLTHSFNHINKNEILNRYKNLLYEKGLTTSNFHVRQDALYDFVSNHYEAEFLAFLESNIIKNDEYNWLKVATRNLKRTVHPLRHILIILCLTGDINTFFSEINKEYNPFGIGPWPCLNHAAEHYRENVIENVKITEDSKTRKPVGTFNCDCGYCYSRTGPDQFDNDRFRKGRVKRFGYLWESKLLELLKEKDTSYRQMAQQMGCDVKTVQKFEIQFKKENGELIENEPFSSIKLEHQKEKREGYKKSLQKILKRNPEMSRKELRKLCQKEYSYLYKYEKEWLLCVLPAVKKRRGSKGSVDWQQRDQEILLQLQTARQELLKEEKPSRISQSALAKKINQLTLLSNHLNKLPNCKEFISTFCETTQEFQIRRCQKIINDMQVEGIQLAEWKVWRKAGLRQEAYETIKGKLNWGSYH